jgi:hypothetical protein
MWLSSLDPWQGDLDDMLARINGRLERIQRTASAYPEHAAANAESLEDTAGLVDVLTKLVAS